MITLVTFLLLASGEPIPSTDRASEDAMFGAAPEAVDAGAADAGTHDGGADTGTTPATSDAGLTRDEAMLESKTPYQTTEQLPPDNPLTIGGLLYLRSQLSASQGEPPSHYLLDAPFLLDTYLDARPNDRVRAFALLRTEWDPTYVATSASTYSFLLEPLASNPTFLIDQLWIKFDVARKVFVTAGRQHVKWGTAHFWFPNDLLNPVRLSPISVFDQRTGMTMIKADVPLSAQNLNLYAFALFDNLQVANQLGKLGGAARVEYVLDSVEVGVDYVGELGLHNRYGADISFGLGDFDLYAEGALLNHYDAPVYAPIANGQPDLNLGLIGSFAPAATSAYLPQVAAGLNYSLRYGNNRLLTFGGEYFYNGQGYTNPSDYPWLILNNAATFFYLGQQYAGLYILADKPGSWYNSTINLSALGNLSDQTFITRIDFFQTILTHLRVEAFAQVHYGGNGEFHFSLPAFGVGSPIADVGLALRVSL